MMNETACVVGIDIAKRKFDIALLINNKIRTKVFDNTPAGYQAFTDWLSERGAIPEQTHLCMEATGPYSDTLNQPCGKGLARECGESSPH